MSVSPRKRSNGVPEVVIYTKPKSPSKKLAREKAEQEEAEFAGLTRIEQIRLRARRKAEKEDRERQEADRRPNQRQRTVEYDEFDDDDDLDELPDLNFKRVTRQAATGSLKSSPPNQLRSKSYDSDFDGPLSSLTVSTDDIPSSLSLPHSQNGPATVQRSRRATARVEPYIFRPSLDPVSKRRQKLKDAKESAAVQANVIKTEDFKKSAYEGKSDTIDRVLREHRREQRKGLDVNGLYATIKMVEGLNDMMDSQEETDQEMQDDVESQSDSDDDTSVASSSRLGSSYPISAKGSGHVRFEQSLTEEELERERQSFLALTGGEEGGKDGDEMFAILIKDRELANRKRQVGQDADVGLRERSFWKEEKVPMEKVIFSKADCDGTIYAMLRDASDSGNDARLIALLSSGALTDQLKLEDGNCAVREIASWLFDVAVLTPTSHLSFVALQVLHDITSSESTQKIDTARAMMDRLPHLLSKLGAKEEILEECLSRIETEKDSQDTSCSSYVRRGERTRAVERLLHVVDLMVRAMKEEALLERRKDGVQLFLVVLRLGIDPLHSDLKPQIERLLEYILDSLLRDDAEVESLLFSKLKTLLLSVLAPTTRLAILSIMPSTNLRSRSVQRRLAYVSVITTSTESTSCNDYNTLATILASKSAAINPLLATKERDYKQVDANAQLLCYALNDLALQLLVTGTSQEESIPTKNALTKAIQNYIDYDEDSATFVRLLLSSSEQKEENGKEEKWKVSTNQVDGIHRIIASLHNLSTQIHEGKGAFLDRSIVKDQLQRLRLMLLYILTDFGLAGTDTSKTLQQGKLSKWFK